MFTNVDSEKTVLVLVGSLVGVWASHQLLKGKGETLLVLMGGGIGGVIGHEVFRKDSKRKLKKA